ncbi:MAG TPA: rhodanese-like domain-containing protein [Syntrophorhabdaceae bacterium]|nr:rhodanese-like domain-containing protein [Syntrophorhabdaceae bacterium]
MRPHRLPLLIIASAFLAFCGSSKAQEVTTEELRAMMDRQTGSLLIVDTRTEFEYKQGRIPGSINISEEKFYNLDALLPPEKNTKLVFYCGGAG